MNRRMKALIAIVIVVAVVVIVANRIGQIDSNGVSDSARESAQEELERDLVAPLIEQAPSACLSEERAFAVVEAAFPRATSEGLLRFTSALIDVCEDRGLWLGD